MRVELSTWALAVSATGPKAGAARVVSPSPRFRAFRCGWGEPPPTSMLPNCCCAARWIRRKHRLRPRWPCARGPRPSSPMRRCANKALRKGSPSAWRFSSRIAALARRPSGRFADFSEIGVHTCLCLKLVRRRGGGQSQTVLRCQNCPAIGLRIRNALVYLRPEPLAWDKCGRDRRRHPIQPSSSSPTT